MTTVSKAIMDSEGDGIKGKGTLEADDSRFVFLGVIRFIRLLIQTLS